MKLAKDQFLESLARSGIDSMEDPRITSFIKEIKTRVQANREAKSIERYHNWRT